MASFDLGIRIKKRVTGNFLIQKVFKLILLYQQVKTDFFLQQSLSRY